MNRSGRRQAQRGCQRGCWCGAALILYVVGAGACGRTPLTELGANESVAGEASTRAQGGQANISIGQGGAPTRPLQGSPCADLDGEWTWVPTVTPIDDFPLPGAGSQNPIGLRLTPSGEDCAAEFLPDWSTPWVRTLKHVPDGLNYAPPTADYVEAPAIWCQRRELSIGSLAIDVAEGPQVRGEGRQTDYYGDEGTWRNVALQGRLTRGLPLPRFAALLPTEPSNEWCTEVVPSTTVGGLFPWQSPVVQSSQIAKQSFEGLFASVEGHEVDMQFVPVSGTWEFRKSAGVIADYTELLGKTLLVESHTDDRISLRFGIIQVPLEPQFKGESLDRLTVTGSKETIAVGDTTGLRVYTDWCDPGGRCAAGRLEVTGKRGVVVVTRVYDGTMSSVALIERASGSRRLEPTTVVRGSTPSPAAPDGHFSYDDRTYRAAVAGTTEVGIQVCLEATCEPTQGAGLVIIGITAE